jgi:hypothetical protein
MIDSSLRQFANRSSQTFTFPIPQTKIHNVIAHNQRQYGILQRPKTPTFQHQEPP